VAERRRIAAREIARLRRQGRAVEPVVLEGRVIARSFWGKAWCDNLEAYSDFANRLPRGRAYVRNGSVMDLRITSGRVAALVSGSALYRVAVTIKPLARARWHAVVRQCAGSIGALVELLQGRLSDRVMEVLIRPRTGLFPSPGEMAFACSCPDWAAMCKHVAATLYGVGARLDRQPALFFRLRGVDQSDLLTAAKRLPALGAGRNRPRSRLATSALADVFGIELDAPAAAPPAVGGARSRHRAPLGSVQAPGRSRPGAPPAPRRRGVHEPE